MSQTDSIVKGKQAVAGHFGVSLRTVQRWYREPDFPKLSGRRFDLLQIRAWLDARDGKPAPAAMATLRTDPRQPFFSSNEQEEEQSRGKAAEEARLKKLTADIKELELRKLRSELVERDEVKQLYAGRAALYKQSVLALEPFILGLLPDEQRRAKAAEVRQRLREVVENITRPLPGKFETGLELPQGGA